MRSDRRWWWTAVLVAVVVTWIAGIAHGLAFLDEPRGAVFARLAFERDHHDVAIAEQVGVWAMIVAAGAIVGHVVIALALRAEGRTPLLSSAVVALAGMVMLPGLSAYGVGLQDCRAVHLTWWFFALIASSVVVAGCGVLLWIIAARDRERAPIDRVLRPAAPTTVAPARALRSSAGPAARSR